MAKKTNPELIAPAEDVTELSEQTNAADDAYEFWLFGSRNIGVYDGRHYSIRQRKDFEEPAIPKPMQFEREHTLPLRVGGLGEVILPMGLTVVSGATGVGKSTFLRTLGVERVLASEPPDNNDELRHLECYGSADAALMAVVAKIINGSDKLYAIDSLRGPLFETTGSAGTKGIIMPFFTALTRVSNSLARHGMTLVATINPMDEDPEYVRAFLSKLSASVPCFVNLTLSDAENGRFEGTIATRSARKAQSFAFSTADRRDLGQADHLGEFRRPNGGIPAGLSTMQINHLTKEKN